MNFMNNYYQFVTTTLEKTYQNNYDAILKGAQILYDCEVNGGKIYTFGTGHSHMIGQELYGRACGYAKIYPIMEIEMTLATHPTKSTTLERCASYADVLDVLYTIEANDVIIATSNSGRNPLVIEYVSRCKAKGAKIIAITSLKHSSEVTSRHESGLRLFELADVILDNHAPLGDGGVAIDETCTMGPISTITGCFLAQSLVGSFVELLKQNNIDAPVFVSSNIDKGDAYNKDLFENYVIKKTKNGV